MSRFALAAACLMLTLSVCDAQTPQTATSSGASSPSQTEQATSQDSMIRGTLPAALAKSIDSKKLKEGDEVDAMIVAALRTGNGIMIPAGSKIIGHVTQSKARSKGDPDSSLAIVFDKIQIPGKDLSIKGIIQAVGPNPEASSGPDTGAAGAGTMGKFDSSTMASPVSSAGAPVGSNPGHGSSGKLLSPQSTGVVGIKNLQLDSNSVLTSSGKEVKLDQGSQILIKAE